MERFIQVRDNIVRCIYTPEGPVRDENYFLLPLGLQGTETDRCPLEVSVSFEPREIYRNVPDGEPELVTLHTVDGDHMKIANLISVFDRQAWRATMELELDPEEKIFGLGQDEDGVLNKRGTIEYLYQHNMKIPIPMFVSTKGYAVLFHCGCLMIFDDTGKKCRVTLECVEQLDFFVITGSMDEIVAAYRDLTGRAAELPAWAFGYWQSKERYKTQEELVDVAKVHREAGVPLDVVVQDWKTWIGDLWGDKHVDKERFPDLRKAMDELHEMNVRSVVSVWPNYNPGGRDHQEMADAGFLLNDYSTYDAMNPEARKLFWKQMERELYSGGFDGWWCDSTEPFPSPDWGGQFRRPERERYELVGGEHERYLDPAWANTYPNFHAAMVYENQPDKPVVNLFRAGWPGVQQYGTILWAGDTAATWQDLKKDIVKGINVGLSGLPYWTVDAGAFFTGGASCWRKWSGNPDADPVWFWRGDFDGGVEDLGYQEIYTRWLQYGCFLPVFRSHGTDTPREYWNFTEPFRGAILETIRLRYRLMPYILEQARKVVEEHGTIQRSLLFDFPNDPMSAQLEDEYMFGPDLLVCPVTEPMLYGPNSTPVAEAPQVRRCWLPQGADWVDFWTRETYAGGQYVEVPLSLNRIPLFVRAGAVLPMTEGAQFAEDKTPVTMVQF